MNRRDELLCFYTTVAFKIIGFRAIPELFRLRERGLILHLPVDGKSALQFIIDNETDGHLAMLDNPVVNQLIEQKWHAYGQVRILQLIDFFLRIKV